jgi:integral membrane sensor domain MASE1
MNNRRAKLMASATVLGLGALGGVAMSTNQGIPPTQQLSANGSSAVVTSASGAVAAQPVAATTNTRAPIVTRASGGGLPVQVDD